MKWDILRVRLAQILDDFELSRELVEALLADIDAAVPAMELEAKSAECWRRYVWLTEEATRNDPKDMNVRGAVFLRECIHDSCETPFEEWINEQRT